MFTVSTLQPVMSLKSVVTFVKELQPGQSATVRSVCAPDGMQRRLRDLGLIENTRVVCLGRSPMGDPSAYLIRGTVIALRRCDCRGIRVAVS